MGAAIPAARLFLADIIAYWLHTLVIFFSKLAFLYYSSPKFPMVQRLSGLESYLGHALKGDKGLGCTVRREHFAGKRMKAYANLVRQFHTGFFYNVV